MKNILVIGGGAMGSAFTIPSLENKNNVTITEPYSKRFIKDLSGKNDSEYRIGGTISSSLFSMMQGVQILRVHDVNEVNQSIKIFKSLNFYNG